MDDLLTDQQRADQARIWLRENGLYLLGGVVLGLAGLFGWQQWKKAGTAEAERASSLYEELLTAVRVDRSARAEEIAAQITREFGSTPYGDQARLALAKLKLDHDEADEAATYLQQIVEKGRSSEMRSIARLRLARVLAQQEKYAEALKVLDTAPDSAFAARYHDVRGDVLASMGKPAEARAEYEQALKDAQPGVIDRAFVQAKLDDLGTSAEAGLAGAPGGASGEPAPPPDSPAKP